MDASILPISTPIPKYPAKVTGVISSSVQSGYVGNQAAPSYKVQSTVGATMSNMKQTTDTGAYVVYSSVQGAFISE